MNQLRYAGLYIRVLLLCFINPFTGLEKMHDI